MFADVHKYSNLSKLLYGVIMVDPNYIARLITEDPDLPSQDRTEDLSNDLNSILNDLSFKDTVHDIINSNIKEELISGKITTTELIYDLFNKAEQHSGSIQNAVEVLQFSEDPKLLNTSIEYINGNLIAYDGFTGRSYEVPVASEDDLRREFIALASVILESIIRSLI